MIVVGFCGRARTGKSTLCRELFDAAEHKGWDVVIRPFAYPLKKYVVEDLGYSKEKHPDEYRKHCQEVGAAKRAEDPDHWLNLWEDSIKDLSLIDCDKPLLVLVDDVRYQNELDLLVKSSAVVSFVRHGKREIDDPRGEWRNHESEDLANSFEMSDKQSLYRKGFDYVIDNDKPEGSLEAWAPNFMDGLSDAEACTCEGCMAMFEHRQFDMKKILDELDKEQDNDRDA